MPIKHKQRFLMMPRKGTENRQKLAENVIKVDAKLPNARKKILNFFYTSFENGDRCWISYINSNLIFIE